MLNKINKLLDRFLKFYPLFMAIVLPTGFFLSIGEITIVTRGEAIHDSFFMVLAIWLIWSSGRQFEKDKLKTKGPNK